MSIEGPTGAVMVHVERTFLPGASVIVTRGTGAQLLGWRCDSALGKLEVKFGAPSMISLTDTPIGNWTTTMKAASGHFVAAFSCIISYLECDYSPPRPTP